MMKQSQETVKGDYVSIQLEAMAETIWQFKLNAKYAL